MKLLTTILLALTLLTACSKTKVMHKKGQVIEIANWDYDKTAIPLAGVKVCFIQGSEIFGFQPSGYKKCVLTDAEGKFDIALEIPRKGSFGMQYRTLAPEQNGFATMLPGLSAPSETDAIHHERKIFTVGVYKQFPVVITLNNINYLNDKDSLIVSSYIRFTGKQNNTIIRGVFKGYKSSKSPNYVEGGFGYQVYRNGIKITDVSFDNQIKVVGDSAYYTINY